MTVSCSSRERSAMAHEARLELYAKRAATGRLLPKARWTPLLALVLLVTSATFGCCPVPVMQPAPIEVRRVKPPLLPDRRPEVLARWSEIATVGTETRMPRDLWRLVSEVTAAGWSNAKALEAAGGWEKP